MRYVIFSLLCALLSLVLLTAFAGDIGSPGDPSSGSNIYTLKDIYDYLSGGTEPSLPGSFQEPTAGPGSTMKSTKDIYDDIKAKFDQCNATPDQVMDTVKFFSTDAGNWGPKSGSLTTRSVSNTTVNQPAGYYDAFDLSAVDTDLAQGNIKSGVNIFGVAGDSNVVDTSTGDAATGDIKSGKKAWVDGAEVTGAIATQTLSDSSTTVAAGYYAATTLDGTDTDLVSGNIKNGITLFGVAGDTNVVNTSSGDAAGGDIKSGKKAWVDGSEVTGSMANVGQQNVTPGTAAVTITQGYHNGTGQVEGDADLVGSNIKSGATIFGVAGSSIQASGAATDAQVLTGVTFSNASGASTGTMPDNGAVNITPGTADQTVTVGYHNGSGTVLGDADLVPGNIPIGVTLFGVTGKCHRLPSTGQTTVYSSGDDGSYQLGCLPSVGPCAGSDGCNFNRTDLPWSSSSGTGFTDNLDGTVTDNLTGLIWLKNANCFGYRTWPQALSDCNGLTSGSCGLSDGSSAGDWRLPNINELRSLIDPDQTDLAMPAGHPFTGVQSDRFYWSSTTYAAYTNYAWYVDVSNGDVINDIMFNYYVWPVRSGN